VLFGGVIPSLLISVFVYYEVVSGDNMIFVNLKVPSPNTVTEISIKKKDVKVLENATESNPASTVVQNVTDINTTTKEHTIQMKITELKKSKEISFKTRMKAENPTIIKNNTISAIPITKPTTKATLTTAVTNNLKRTYEKFAVCHSYWEQQTNAVLNMWSFQKWAKKSGSFSVLEPFAHDSVLGFSGKNINQHNFNASLRFRDYFDLDQWTKGTEKYKIPPLVNWDDFVEHASRNIVLAVLVYDQPGGIFEGDDIKKNPGCVSEAQRFRTILKNLLGFMGFNIEKVVCYSIVKYFRTLKDFNSPFDPNSTSTIYFTLWPGIGRIRIGDRSLQRIANLMFLNCCCLVQGY